jgi:hypothetical protein
LGDVGVIQITPRALVGAAWNNEDQLSQAGLTASR